VFSGSLEVVDLRFVLRKILRLFNVEWKTNPNYLSRNFRSRLSYQCQHFKELFERILKIQYRNNILDVFINQLHDDDCLWIFLTRRGYSPHSRGDSSLLAAIFHDRLMSRLNINKCHVIRVKRREIQTLNCSKRFNFSNAYSAQDFI
jgi:hypothetical protein